MIHHIYANQSNIGDWLSALGIQSLLPSVNVVEPFCDEPFTPDTLAALSECAADDFVIIGGGGLFMDYFTIGRGVMLAWPLSSERFAPPFHLFYGLRWSHGLISELHWITLLSELFFVGVLFFGLRYYERRRAGGQRSEEHGPRGPRRGGAGGARAPGL